MSTLLPVRQQSILACITESLADHGRPPSIREIGAATGISSTSVVEYHVGQLVEKGLLRREPMQARGLVPAGGRCWCVCHRGEGGR